MGEITHEWVDDTNPIIPEISDKALFAFAGAFTHLVGRDGVYSAVEHDLTTKALRNTSCIWDPTITGARHILPGEQAQVPFYVSCGYYGFFKPSIAEVAACAPIEDLQARGFNAFYIADHVEILKSGSFQRATAIFVKVAADTPLSENRGAAA